jgi:hypothetical protein
MGETLRDLALFGISRHALIVRSRFQHLDAREIQAE